jgi:hypothetical protein
MDPNATFSSLWIFVAINDSIIVVYAFVFLGFLCSCGSNLGAV